MTIIGESAGGGSVMHQITAYGGLKGPVPFHQAIVQSPGFQMTPSAYHEESIFQDFLTTAGVGTLQEARGLTSDQLQLANWKIVGESYPYGTFTFSKTPLLSSEENSRKTRLTSLDNQTLRSTATSSQTCPASSS